MVRVTSVTSPPARPTPAPRPRTVAASPRKSASARTVATISARVTPRARSIPIVARRWTTENVIVLYARKRPTINARSDIAVRFTSKACVSSPTNSLRAAAGTTSTPGGSAARTRVRTSSPRGPGGRMRSTRDSRPGWSRTSWAVVRSATTRPRSACSLRASSGSIRPTTRTGRDRPLTRSTRVPETPTPSSVAVSRLTSTAPGSVTSLPSTRVPAPAPRPPRPRYGRNGASLNGSIPRSWSVRTGAPSTPTHASTTGATGCTPASRVSRGTTRSSTPADPPTT